MTYPNIIISILPSRAKNIIYDSIPLLKRNIKCFCLNIVKFIFYSYLLADYCVFVTVFVIRTAFDGIPDKPIHFVLVQIDNAGIALVFLVIFVIHAGIA